jgi:acetoin utilization deacetylase AcuC-like enzyme
MKSILVFKINYIYFANPSRIKINRLHEALMDTGLTIYTHESSLEHDTLGLNREAIGRIRTIYALLAEQPYNAIPRGDVRPVTEEQLLYAHPFNYIRSMEKAVHETGKLVVDDDTVFTPKSWIAALHAAGGVCSAVDDVAAGKTLRAFSACRPPGHHAEPEEAMGYCLFNNVFIGARHAQEKHGIGKVAIVDFDVHHGNGTDTLTRRHDGSILFISTQEAGLWPGTGLEEDNEESVMNFTLPPGSGSESFRSLYREKIFPALDRFAPDLVMISAGFDAHRLDPLGNLNLETEDFGWVTEELIKIADRHSGGKIVSVLEGGYDLEALKASVAAHLDALLK